MAEKKFTTIEEQITILKSRGLSISDEEKAKEFLIRNNYYRVSGYSLTLRSNDVFFPSADFQNIIDIYEFDHELRHILLSYINKIEVAFKSIYSYEFARVYGSVGYKNVNLFQDKEAYTKIIDKVEELKRKRHPHEAFLKHYIDELKEEIPIWIYIELLTISDISRLYSITEENIKAIIANAMGFKFKNGSLLLEKFMHSITILRNLCAHGSRLYNRLFEQKPSLKNEDKSLLRELPNGKKDYAHLFSYILVIKRLLKPEDFYCMKKDIINIKKKYSFVNMKYYGFCDDWEKSL